VKDASMQPAIGISIVAYHTIQLNWDMGHYLNTTCGYKEEEDDSIKLLT
jgi:hypothetical protein